MYPRVRIKNRLDDKAQGNPGASRRRGVVLQKVNAGYKIRDHDIDHLNNHLPGYCTAQGSVISQFAEET